MNLLCRGRCYTWGKMDELQTLRELDSHTPNKNFSQGTIWLSVLVFLRVRQLRIDAVSSRKVKTYERRTWRFIYPSVLTKKPLYSSPHFRRTNTGFPVSSCKNGFGFTGLTCGIREQCRTSKWRNSQQPWWLRKARADFEKKVTTINLVYISCMTIRFYSLLWTSLTFALLTGLEMSDREGHSGPPPTDEDLSLPKATVAKMIAGMCIFTRLNLLSDPLLSPSQSYCPAMLCALKRRVISS